MLHSYNIFYSKDSFEYFLQLFQPFRKEFQDIFLLLHNKDLPISDSGILKLGAEQRFGAYKKVSPIEFKKSDTGNFMSLSIVPIRGHPGVVSVIMIVIESSLMMISRTNPRSVIETFNSGSTTFESAFLTCGFVIFMYPFVL